MGANSQSWEWSQIQMIQSKYVMVSAIQKPSIPRLRLIQKYIPVLNEHIGSAGTTRTPFTVAPWSTSSGRREWPQATYKEQKHLIGS